MNGDVKEWLLSEIADAEARLADAQADYDSACRMLARYEASQPALATSSTEDIRIAAIEVLAHHEEPIHRQVIFDELLAIGVHIHGKDPVAGLGTVLSRCSEVFVSHGQGIWGLKEWSVNHIPAPLLINGHTDDL